MPAVTSRPQKNSMSRPIPSTTSTKMRRPLCRASFGRRLRTCASARTNSKKINTIQAHASRCKASPGLCAIPNEVTMKMNQCPHKKAVVLGSLATAVIASGLLIAARPAPGYVAHEWGTFTSVQGGDGVLLDWRPLESSHLPKFVYDWTHAGLNRQPAGKLAPRKA